MLAHGIWLDDADRAALRAAGAQIAHCPSSNLFLGSGLFDWRARRGAGVAVSASRSDVGGGTSLSMLRTLADAYKVQALAGQRLTAWKALHAATRGAAEALGLAHEIGSLRAGRDGRRLRLGLGRRPGRAPPRTRWRATCMSASSPG